MSRQGLLVKFITKYVELEMNDMYESRMSIYFYISNHS